MLLLYTCPLTLLYIPKLFFLPISAVLAPATPNSPFVLFRERQKPIKRKTRKSSPELRGLVRVFLRFSPEVRVNFWVFPFVGFSGTASGPVCVCVFSPVSVSLMACSSASRKSESSPSSNLFAGVPLE